MTPKTFTTPGGYHAHAQAELFRPANENETGAKRHELIRSAAWSQ